MHSTLTKIKTNISIRKMHQLAQGLRKVKFRWNQVSIMATQNFKRNLPLILYREGKKVWHWKHLTLAAYFLHLETPSLPACYPLNTTKALYSILQICALEGQMRSASSEWSLLPFSTQLILTFFLLSWWKTYSPHYSFPKAVQVTSS